MITYIYLISIIALSLFLLYLIGYRFDEWKAAAATSLGILIIGFLAYHFHFQQVFVKRYGGVMTISVPAGEIHLAATWKDDNLWIENYNPKTDTCHFREYSRGNLLQGQVTIRNCNPLLRKASISPELP